MTVLTNADCCCDSLWWRCCNSYLCHFGELQIHAWEVLEQLW